MINVEDLKTLPQQVYKNTVEIEEIKPKAEKALEALNIANTALSLGQVALVKSDRCVEAVQQAWEKHFIDIEIKPEDFDEDLEYNCVNELFKLKNVITVSPAPDNFPTISNNSKNISYYEMRPLEQIVDDAFVLKVKELPGVSLFIRIEVDVQIEVKL